MTTMTSTIDYDDCDSSNIANMLQRAHQKSQQRNDSDDSSDDDDEETMTPPRRAMSARKRTSSTLKRNEKLSAIRKRRMDLEARLNADSDDDEDEDDEIQMVANPAVNPQSSKRAPAILELDDLSDDDDDFTPGYNSYQRTRSFETKNQQALGRLSALHQASAELRRAQTNRVNDIERDATYDSLYEMPHYASLLALMIVPHVDENSKHNDNIPPLVYCSLSADQTGQMLIDQFLSLTKLDKSKYTVGLKFDGITLDPKRPLSKYSLTSGSKIDATVLRSTLSASSSGTSKKSLASLGRVVALKLRSSKNADDIVKIHMKESFQVLADRYRSLKKLKAGQKLVLNFDGEQLGMHDTPEIQDMDDEDLIDVIIL